MLLLIFVAALGLRVGVASTFVGLTSPPAAARSPITWTMKSLPSASVRAKATLCRPERRLFIVHPGTSWSLLPVYVLVGRSYA